MSAREGSETNPQQENQPQTVAPNLEKSISTSSMDEPRAVPVQAALSLDGQQNNSQLSQEQQNSSEGENIVQNSENAANDANHQLAEVAVVEGIPSRLSHALNTQKVPEVFPSRDLVKMHSLNFSLFQLAKLLESLLSGRWWKER